MKAVIEQLSKTITDTIKKFSKMSFCDSSKHECDFNRDSYHDEKLDFIVKDKKYYKSCERVDVLTMSRVEVEKRLAKVALFDRKSFEREFDYEATYVIACNSKAVALNLCEHERKYSTLYRHLALYNHRADLYLMCAMSNSQRATCFNSSHFTKAVELQAKELSVEQIQKATCDKKYEKVAEQLKAMYLAEMKKKSSAKSDTAKLIKSKTAKAVEKKVVAVAK